MCMRQIVTALTPRTLLLLASAFSLAMLGGAFTAQYGFELYPCELCVYQRYPYITVLVLAAIAAYRLPPRIQLLAAYLCAVLFLGNAGLGFYHTGVEQGWFKGPSGCSSASTGAETLEELRRQIMEAPLVACDQAMGYVFGLSLAAWNAFLALLAGIATLAAAMVLQRKASA